MIDSSVKTMERHLRASNLECRSLVFFLNIWVLRCSSLSLVLLLCVVGCSRNRSDIDLSDTDIGLRRSVVEEQMSRTRESDLDIPESSLAHYNFLRGELALHNERYDEALSFFYLASKYETQPAALLRVRLAQLYVRKGELAKALAELNKADSSDDKSHSSSPELLRLKAGIYASLKDYDKAVESYRELIDLEPGNQDYYILLSSLYAQVEDFEKATSVLHELIAASPDSSLLGYYYLARMSESRGDFSEAEDYYRKAIEINPNAEAIQIDFARSLAIKGRRDESIDICKQVLVKNPRSLAAKRLLGQLLWEGKKLQEALQELGELRMLEEDPTETRLKIALIKLEGKDYAGAEVELNLVLAAHPEHSTARYFLASVYMGLGNFDDAVKILREISAKQKMFVESRTLVAYLLKQEGHLGGAAKAIEEALRVKKGDVNLILYLVSLRRETGELKEALRLVKSAIELDTNVDRHYFTLGVIYDELGKSSDAIASMRKAIELNSNNASALNYLGYTLANDGESLDEAELLIKRALESDKENGYYIDSLGWVYYKMGRFDEALAQLETAVKYAPDDAVILEHLAETQLSLGQEESAFVTFKKALTFAPDSEDKEVLDRIKLRLDKLQKKE